MAQQFRPSRRVTVMPLLRLALFGGGAVQLTNWVRSSSVLPAALVGAPRRVLVTGGNKGIGKALCQQLAADHGYHVFLGSRDESRGVAAVQDILRGSPECDGRLEFLSLDVADDSSVAAAAEIVKAQCGESSAPLCAIINNAGVGFSRNVPRTVNINYYGTKRVCEAFMPMLDQTSGRIINTASASGPNYVSRCDPEERAILTDPDVTPDMLAELISKTETIEAYGLSKACVNAYTRWLARTNSHLKINSITPGFIKTDMTLGMGADKSPEEGTKAALHCLMGELKGNGWYYGSDAQRSPIDRYRSPGDPPYEGP